jgi:Flp pilus assembly protein TadD
MGRKKIGRNKAFGKRTLLLLCAAVAMPALIAGCSQWKRFVGSIRGGEYAASSQVTEKQIARAVAGIRPARSNPDPHYQLALHYQKRGRYNEALRAFKQAVDIDPRHFDALNGMGVSYDMLKEYSRAQAAYGKALRIRPDSAEVLNNLGYSMFLQGNYDEALTSLEEAVTLDGGNPRYRNNLALARLEMGDHEGAFEQFSYGSEEAEAHVLMGNSYYRKGTYRKAAAHFSDALRMDPDVKGADKGLEAALALAEILEPAAAAAVELSAMERKAGRSGQGGSGAGQGEGYVLVRCHVKEDDGKQVTVLRSMQMGAYLKSLQIEIMNRSGKARFSDQVSRFLKDRGYTKIVLLDGGKETLRKTKIYYRADYLQPAYRIAGDIPGYQDMEKVDTFASSDAKVRVVIGKDMARYAAMLSDKNKYAFSSYR